MPQQHPGPHRSPVSAFSDALNLIASGSADDKVRWIAERDPDWFVDHVLRHTLLSTYPYEPEGGRIDRRMLDQAIASIALRDCATVRMSAAS